MQHTLRLFVLIAGIAVAGAGTTARADELLNTGEPGGPFGFIGFDLFTGQSVAIGFTPKHNYFLDEVAVWIMSNDFGNPGATFTLSLRPNDTPGKPTHPSDTIIESWDIATTAVGWDPVLERRRPKQRTVLEARKTYWLVAESSEAAGENPVWVWGSNDVPVPFALIDFASSPEWQEGTAIGSAPGAIVRATKRGR